MRGVVIAVVVVVMLGGACDTGDDESQQTTTTFGPTTTIDIDALNATWALSGNWLIHAPGTTDAAVGFASFNPQVTGDRYVSTGYGPCYMFSGRAVESDGFMQVVQIEGALDPLVECDPGPATETYSQVVECLQTGCRLDLAGDVLRLSSSTSEPVADLIRTADEIPPR
ncbi:MAG: hypothetical protein R2697_13975 [Ilumatobacteraceae bacterium]